MNKQLLREGLAGVAVGFTTLVASFTLGYPSPALPSMDEDPDFNITTEEGSWIGSVVAGAALFGSLGSSILLDTYGRQYVLLSSTVTFMLSWLGISLTSSLSIIILCRIISGLSLGIQAVAGSVYQTEMIHVSMRPKLGILPALMGNLGLLVVSIAGIYCNWRQLALLGAILCCPVFVLYLYLPETPYHLSKTGHHETALRTLQWLRNSHTTASNELNEYKMSTKEKLAGVSISGSLRPPYRWGLIVSLGLHIFQQTTGINAIIFYSTVIFEQAGSSVDSAFSSVMMMAANVISTILALSLLAYGNRTDLLRLSTKYVVASLFIMSAYLFTFQNTKPGFILGFIPLACILVYTIAFALGWGPIPWIFIGEGLFSDVRSIGNSLAIAANWGFAFIVTKSYTMLVESYGLAFIFFMYGILTAFAQVLFNKYLPETVGKSSSQIDRFYVDSYKSKLS